MSHVGACELKRNPGSGQGLGSRFEEKLGRGNCLPRSSRWGCTLHEHSAYLDDAQTTLSTDFWQ
jgi:hypothetical protein